MRRLARVTWPVLAAAALALAIAAPAGAKVGPFSIELTPESPTAGERFQITVRCWHDTERNDPARCPSMGPWFDGFLWAVPAGSDHAATEALPIELVRRGSGVLRASLVLPEAGPWHLCVWAASPCDADGDPGYPSRLELLVLAAPEPVQRAAPDAPAAPSGSSGSPVPVAAASAAVVAVILAGAWGARRSRGR